MKVKETKRNSFQKICEYHKNVINLYRRHYPLPAFIDLNIVCFFINSNKWLYECQYLGSN